MTFELDKSVERRELKPCPCDLSTASLLEAVAQLGQKPYRLHVHVWDKGLAEHLLHLVGLSDVQVKINPYFNTDEWLLVGGHSEIHSSGI